MAEDFSFILVELTAVFISPSDLQKLKAPVLAED